MSTTPHDTEHTRDGRTVRVVCPDTDHGRAGIDLVARCEWCGEWITDAGGTILATLADPEVEARLTLADAYIAWYHGPQDHPTIDLCRARDRVEELMAADPQRAPEAGQGVGG